MAITSETTHRRLRPRARGRRPVRARVRRRRPRRPHPKAAAVLKDKAKAKHSRQEARPSRSRTTPTTSRKPDIADTVAAEYRCELNNKVTIYTNDEDDGHIALRWKNRLHRLDASAPPPAPSASRTRKFGLIWIGIPAKGILLDSKLNRQLANECKNAEQAKPGRRRLQRADAPGLGIQ